MVLLAKGLRSCCPTTGQHVSQRAQICFRLQRRSKRLRTDKTGAGILVKLLQGLEKSQFKTYGEHCACVALLLKLLGAGHLYMTNIFQLL